MDIIIRNGVIQNNKQNEEKIPWEKFNINISGPYYDPCKNHLCVFRKPHLIQNFNGPQKYSLKKIIKTNYDSNKTFCSICHEPYKNKFDFLAKKKIFIDDDYYNPKYLNNKNNNDNKYKLYYKKLNIKDFFNKYLSNIKNINIENIKHEFRIIKNKRNKIYNKYYQLTYKILFKPIIYPISNKENKIIWPWNITSYQNLILKNPNYKKSEIYIDKLKINNNYIIIE